MKAQLLRLGEERDAYVFKQVQQLAKKNKFSLDKPIKDLPENSLNLILYGMRTKMINNMMLSQMLIP